MSANTSKVTSTEALHVEICAQTIRTNLSFLVKWVLGSFVVSFQVVLASIPDMQCGFSRDLFIQWCGQSKNTIILTNRTSPGTLSRQLIENPNQKTIQLEVSALLFVVTWKASFSTVPCALIVSQNFFVQWSGPAELSVSRRGSR